MSDLRQTLIDQLEREMRDNTSFVRVHAAEVLCEHGFGFKVGALFAPDVETTTLTYRVGVARVMARIAANDAERQKFVGRIRRIMLDADAPDRIAAAESLAKLGVADRADRAPLEQWLTTAEDVAAPFPLWLLLHSSTATERPGDQARLARYLESSEPIARLRASYALGRLGNFSPEHITHLNRRAAVEPADSEARVYLFGAAFLYAERGSAPAAALQRELARYLETGKANEQFEAATVIGLRGTAADRALLTPVLKAPEADARIGAAGALIRLAP